MKGGYEARERWPDDEAPTARQERRAWERIAVNVEVTLTSESQFYAGLTGDISKGGLFLQTYERYVKNHRVSVAFSLPTGEIRTTGVVRWFREASEGTAPGVGIEFDNLGEIERRRIENFCRARPPLYHDHDDYECD
jgi:uncharacterized protein (TIGR02266 family)